MQEEYIITLMSGGRIMGTVKRNSAHEARIISQEWNAGSDRHTSSVERCEFLTAEKADIISSDQYLVQQSC